MSPLYVDLDGTFIKTDMLHECFFSALKKEPLVLFWVFFWLLKGRPYLKQKLWEISNINVASIPVNESVHEFIQEQKQRGRKILLATASIEQIAAQFCQHYPVFDDYLGSDESVNLKGSHKLARIEQESPVFAYMGNSSEDYLLFDKAAESYLVEPTSKAKRKRKTIAFVKEFEDKSRSFTKAFIKQIRLHQWLKNMLLFVPLFVDGQFFNVASIALVLLAFVSFALLASATYIVNDLVDLESDRAHPNKRNRPLAAGRISLVDGIAISTLFFALSFFIALQINIMFFVVLCVYLLLTLSYSFKLKTYFGMDVVALASLYTIRIFAGAAALGIAVSFWLLSFSMFVFLSLALVKRCAELVLLAKHEKESAHGRDYNVSDLQVFIGFGTSSALLAVLMYCFYLNTDILTTKYPEPRLLWLSILPLTYWLIRMWVKTIRGEMHDDPIVFSLKDKGSVISVGMVCLITLLANIV